MVGNRSFWPRVTTTLAKHAAGQVACRTSCKIYLSRARPNYKDYPDISVSWGGAEAPSHTNGLRV